MDDHIKGRNLLLSKIRSPGMENNSILWEASSLDQINMTKNRLEFDQKILTTTNLNFGT